jgi:hypothetical protein
MKKSYHGLQHQLLDLTNRLYPGVVPGAQSKASDSKVQSSESQTNFTVKSQTNFTVKSQTNFTVKSNNQLYSFGSQRMSTKDMLPNNSQGSSTKFILKDVEEPLWRVSWCVKSKTNNLEDPSPRLSSLVKPLNNDDAENPLKTFQRMLTARRIALKASKKCSHGDFNNPELELSNRTIAKTKWQATGMDFFTEIENNLNANSQQKKEIIHSLAVPVKYHCKRDTLPEPGSIIWPSENKGGVMKKKLPSFSASRIDSKSGVISDLSNLDFGRDSCLRTLPANPLAKYTKDSKTRGNWD